MIERISGYRDTIRHAAETDLDEAHRTGDPIRRAWLLGRVSGLDYAADLIDVLIKKLRREK